SIWTLAAPGIQNAGVPGGAVMSPVMPDTTTSDVFVMIPPELSPVQVVTSSSTSHSARAGAASARAVRLAPAMTIARAAPILRTPAVNTAERELSNRLVTGHPLYAARGDARPRRPRR